ncbi:MAG: hypothetical protein COB50_04560 [Thiotrichales bacterium]|nr:MAG: hypothetical protein COB50_04560 [Thiotrichales bacterium]
MDLNDEYSFYRNSSYHQKWYKKETGLDLTKVKTSDIDVYVIKLIDEVMAIGLDEARQEQEIMDKEEREEYQFDDECEDHQFDYDDAI